MRGFIRLAVSAAALPFALGLVPANAQTAPKFAVDASWPKDLPKDWITGQLGGVCTLSSCVFCLHSSSPRLR